MDEQDTSCAAWSDLLEYVDECSRRGVEEFAPFTRLGTEMYHDIVTLPAEIRTLESVRTLTLVHSAVSWLPREVGSMRNLEEFVIYGSHRLHWVPYEITRCGNLRSSLVSTRRIYGNFKNRAPFPDLRGNPVTLGGYGRSCSVCGGGHPDGNLQQYWISALVGTDVMPLLATVCSPDCLAELCVSAGGYIKGPHLGGLHQVQPKGFPLAS